MRTENMSFQVTYRKKVEYINQGLSILLEQRPCYPTLLNAIKYSIQAGGKRLRPVLFLSAFELASQVCSQRAPMPGELDQVRPMACAIEMIHTYSLIHDDLPAMDDDDYRRGKPTNHKVFGEATAILAGDGLLNLAYEVMLENLPAVVKKLPDYLRAMSVIAGAAGISGMISGQCADMEIQSNNSCEDRLTYIHAHKTEALITSALKAGVMLRGGSMDMLNAVSGYGKALGLAFQITDDILDLTGDLAQLGKDPGSDKKMGKLTYPAKYGLSESKRMAQRYIEQAIHFLKPFGRNAEFLVSLANSILDRNQ
jgi:geranylgeranyl diphosphate synthase type II